MTDHAEAPLADQIADAIMARLSGNILSGVLPAEPMQAVRNARNFSQWTQVYLSGADAIIVAAAFDAVALAVLIVQHWPTW